MFKTILVEADIQAGEQLVEALEHSGLQISAALWYYFEEADDWRLLIASPAVDTDAHASASSLLREALQRLPPNAPFSRHNIQLVGPKQEIIKLIRKRFRIGPGDPPSRLQRGAIDAVYIDDAYIYRSQ